MTINNFNVLESEIFEDGKMSCFPMPFKDTARIESLKKVEF